MVFLFCWLVAKLITSNAMLPIDFEAYLTGHWSQPVLGVWLRYCQISTDFNADGSTHKDLFGVRLSVQFLWFKISVLFLPVMRTVKAKAVTADAATKFVEAVKRENRETFEKTVSEINEERDIEKLRSRTRYFFFETNDLKQTIHQLMTSNKMRSHAGN